MFSIWKLTSFTWWTFRYHVVLLYWRYFVTCIWRVKVRVIPLVYSVRSLRCPLLLRVGFQCHLTSRHETSLAFATWKSFIHTINIWNSIHNPLHSSFILDISCCISSHHYIRPCTKNPIHNLHMMYLNERKFISWQLFPQLSCVNKISSSRLNQLHHFNSFIPS